MFLVSVLLPLYDNDRVSFPPEMFRAVANELTEKFGGLTAHTRAPAQGLWQNQTEAPPLRDDIVIYEVMAEMIDRAWWSAYRRELERRFRQEHVIIRASDVELL
jgi:hypothetical protein